MDIFVPLHNGWVFHFNSLYVLWQTYKEGQSYIDIKKSGVSIIFTVILLKYFEGDITLRMVRGLRLSWH